MKFVLRPIAFLFAILAASAGGSGPAAVAQQPPPADLEAQVVALVERSFPKAGAEQKAAFRARVLKPFLENAGNPRTSQALVLAENLIGSVVGTAEHMEKRLKAGALDSPTATRRLPEHHFAAEYELSVELVEKTLRAGFKAPEPDATQREALRNQVADLVSTWKTALVPLLDGSHALELADALAERKKLDLESKIGDPFVGLTRSLDAGEIRAVKEHLWSEAKDIRERLEVSDPRLVRVVTETDRPIPEEFSEAQVELVGKIIGLRNRFGNSLHRMWYFNHPDLAPLLARQHELKAALEREVEEIQKREGTRFDQPPLRDPEPPSGENVRTRRRKSPPSREPETDPFPSPPDNKPRPLPPSEDAADSGAMARVAFLVLLVSGGLLVGFTLRKRGSPPAR